MNQRSDDFEDCGELGRRARFTDRIDILRALFADVTKRRQIAAGIANRRTPVPAIRALTTINRQHQDGSIEADLVMLRRAAFKHLPRKVGMKAPEESVEDMFGEGQAIPEIDAKHLTVDSLRSGIFVHGALIVRTLFDQLEAAEFRCLIDKACSGLSKAAAASKIGQKQSRWYTPFPEVTPTIESSRAFGAKGGSVLSADSPPALFKYLDCIEKRGLKKIIGEYLGETPAISVEKSTLRRVVPDPSRDWSAGWHQDGAFLGKDVVSLNLWLSLSECGKDAPSIDIVSKRLNGIVPTGTPGAAFGWSISPKLIDDVASDASIVRPEFAPGDAIFFDHYNLHRTGVDKNMTATRYAIETWFFAPSRFPEGRTGLLV